MKHAETNKVRFEAELIQGHKGVTVVLVPFDPEDQWSIKPMRLVGRRHGWVVAGSANGIAFDGYIGERWDRFFIIIEKNLREAAKVNVGDKLALTVQPTSGAGALAKALEQSRVTTQPKTARSDAIQLQESPGPGRVLAKRRRLDNHGKHNKLDSPL
jgi:hypothetical protein